MRREVGQDASPEAAEDSQAIRRKVQTVAKLMLAALLRPFFRALGGV